MGNLFGTDGIRGIANVDLTCDLATKVGRAMAYVLLKNKNENPTVLIGKDTRLSSDMLESALAAGLCSVGVNVISLGVVPTPAVAFLVRKYNICEIRDLDFNLKRYFNYSGNEILAFDVMYTILKL